MPSDDVQHHLKRHLDERMPLTPTLLPTNDPASPDDNVSSTSASTSTSTQCTEEQNPTTLNISPCSSPLPDSQHPLSPTQPSPLRLSPSPSGAALMQRFLDSCETSCTRPAQLPLAEMSPTTTTKPNPNPNPNPDPNPNTPILPLMANIIATRDLHRQAPPIRPRPRAADFFSPTIESLPMNDSPQPPPPRPDAPPPTRCPSSLIEDPSSQHFPSQDRASTLESFRLKYQHEFDEAMNFDTFSTLANSFAQEALTLARELSSQQRPKPTQRRPDRPSARPPIDNRRPTNSDHSTARRLRHLYRISKKRAARKIFGDDSPGFDGTTEDATTFFSNAFGPRSCNTDSVQAELNAHVPSADVDETLFDPPNPEELASKLRTMANSAPGKDRIEYRHLRLLDPKCLILARLFKHCFSAKDVPASWKNATTILIHKKESTTDPANFRPIALMSCLYKLLMVVLAKRMTTFSITNDLLSNAQKKARPSEGCYEHAFILESVLSDARRQPRPLCLAWLDIRNAFGSIPHSVLSTALLRMGFPPDLVRMITNVYTGATTEVLTSTGKTPPIPIHSGVKQGCPLSAILFNLSLELVIRKCISAAAQSHRGPLKHHGLSIPFSRTLMTSFCKPATRKASSTS